MSEDDESTEEDSEEDERENDERENREEEDGVVVRRSTRRRVSRYGSFNLSQSWILGGGAEARGYPSRQGRTPSTPKVTLEGQDQGHEDEDADNDEPKEANLLVEEQGNGSEDESDVSLRSFWGSGDIYVLIVIF